MRWPRYNNGSTTGCGTSRGTDQQDRRDPKSPFKRAKMECFNNWHLATWVAVCEEKKKEKKLKLDSFLSPDTKSTQEEWNTLLQNETIKFKEKMGEFYSYNLEVG